MSAEGAPPEPELRWEPGEVSVAEDLRLAYVRAGSGPSTLVVPAASWVARDLEPLAAGRTVVSYDLRGRGRSSAVLELDRLSLERDVEDLEALTDALDLERVSLLGWSYHAAVAVRWALRHPERLERLILVGSIGPRAQPWFDLYLDAFARSVDLDALEGLSALRAAGLPRTDPERWCRAVQGLYLRAYVRDPRHLERMRSSPCVEPNLDAERINGQGRRVLERLGDYDWRADARALAAPVLLVHGTRDPVPLDGSREWLESLPQARLLVLEDVAHMPWLERPESFFDALETFLDGGWPAAVEGG